MVSTPTMTSERESDKAKEERLREKLKRKAEERKSTKDGPSMSATANGASSPKEREVKQGGRDTKKESASPKGGGSSSSLSPQSSSNNRNRRRNRNNRPNQDYRGPVGRYDGPPNGRGGPPQYRDPYWRPDGPPQGYDNYRRNGYGWNGNGAGGYDNYNRPGDGYWRGGDRNAQYHHERERYGRNAFGRGSQMSPNGGTRDSSRNERGRTRSRSFSRSRSRSRSYSRSYSRSVSRSNSVSSRSRSLSSEGSRGRSLSSERSRSSRHEKRGRSGSHESDGKQTYEVKKSRSLSSEDNSNEPSDPLTKDQRTVFISQLVMKTLEKDIKRFFKKTVGCKVNDVQILRDKRTGRNKGCAYVELNRLEDVPRALASSGSTPEFQRFPILVKASEAEKNYGAGGMPVPTGMPKRVEAQKVYVGSVDRNVTQAQLYTIFSQFGELDKVTLQVDTTTGMSKGFAFLSFKDPKVANLAIQAMSGQVLAGRAFDKMEDRMGDMDDLIERRLEKFLAGTAFVEIVFLFSWRTGWANLNSAVPNLEEVSSTEFPDDAVARIGKVNEVFKKLNATGLAPLPSLTLIPGMGQNNREELLKELNVPPAPSSTITNAAEAAVNAAFVGLSAPGPTASTTETDQGTKNTSPPEDTNNPKAVTGTLSNIILVRNMFDKDEETEDGWEEDIRLDFEEESSKHGKILCVKVMSKEVGGKIFASFETVDGAKACAENLAGRWFDKRQLHVEFVSEETFEKL